MQDSKLIGEGSSSLIYREWKDGLPVAVKVVTKPSATTKREILALEKLQPLKHPGIIQLLSVEEDSSHYRLTFEFLDKSLFAVLKEKGRFNEKEAKPLFRQMVEALKACHNAGICHRDLKLEHFLFDSSHSVLKLIDFGLSGDIKPGKLFTRFCGSLAYSAPEILCETPKYDHSVDVWSLGVILYAMLCGRFPFYGRHREDTLRRIRTQRLVFPDKEVTLSESAKDLIQRMLRRDRKQRIAVDEILSHSWLEEKEEEEEKKKIALSTGS